ncbi:MAG: hypothetical protein ACM3Q2_17845 [Syntrophothermus sp.]
MKKLFLPLLLLVLTLYGCKSSILEPSQSSSVNFTILEKSRVKITLKNSYKTQISTVVDEDLMAGRYFYSFEELNLPEGVYVCTEDIRGLQSGHHEINTYKILLVKE